MGEMGISRSEFMRMTPRETWNAFYGYAEKTKREFRDRWDQTRWTGTIIKNSNPYDKKRYQPSDLLKFPWEEEVVDRTNEIELIKQRRKEIKHGKQDAKYNISQAHS